MPKPVAVWNSARDVWETPQTEGFFCEHLDVFLGTFPTSGMTVSGVAYELPTWEPATDDSASSSLPDDAMLGTPTSRMWKGAGPQGGPTQIRNKARGLIEAQIMDLAPFPMLPTPTVSDTNGPGKHGDGGLDLRTSVSLLPTTRAQHGEDRNSNIYPRPLDQPQNLENSLARLLPTPSACVANDGESTETWLARRERVKLTAANGNGMGMPLTIATLLIGESTAQPSDAGKLNSDGQLRGQLNLLDAITDTD